MAFDFSSGSSFTSGKIFPTTVNGSGFSHSSGTFEPNLIGTARSFLGNFGSTVSRVGSSLSSFLGSSGSPSGASSGGYYADVSTPSSRTAVDYPFATISTLYGADAKSAYQEALSNTAIERRMEDLKRSGINPVLAAQAQGADGVNSVGSVSFGSTSGSGSGSGSWSDMTSGSAGANYSGLGQIAKTFVKNSNAVSAVAALASAGTMAVTKNFQLGAAAYYGVNALGSALRSVFK